MAVARDDAITRERGCKSSAAGNGPPTSHLAGMAYVLGSGAGRRKKKEGGREVVLDRLRMKKKEGWRRRKEQQDEEDDDSTPALKSNHRSH